MTSIAETPLLPGLTPAMQAWDEQFRLFGRVIFRQKSRMIVVLLVIGIAIIAAGAVAAARQGTADATAMVLIITGGLLGLPAIFWFIAQRKTTVSVETEGVRLTNGYLLPWDGLEFAGVWSYRSNRSVAIHLTDETMRDYTAQQSRAARMLTKANAALTSSNAVFLPGTLDANPDEFAAWLNVLLDERLQRANASDGYDPFA